MYTLGKLLKSVLGTYAIVSATAAIRASEYISGVLSYEVNFHPAIADVTGDGMPDVTVGSVNGLVYCINGSDGLIHWTYDTGGPVGSSPCIADLDGDGTFEVLIGSNSDSLYCLNHAGGLEWSFATTGNVQSSPTVVDLDRDGIL